MEKVEAERREVAQPAAPAAAPRQASGYHDASWYRQRPGSEYVVQLLGSRSEAAARAFIARHADVSDLGYFETTHQGEPWFVVTQGAYASRQAAQAGVAKLPAALRDSKPWPRGMADIQSALR
ncbi:SPOR domain-containing protein [Pseudomonas abyssi]|uniref:SPOR domain-containing protein n=1 Tax=Pseudomonas abyssi TaxID=170540 RepID=A0A395R234_9PSED|nr:SPOR domain-containing protein [Halopseudomonas gallaeciensis]RGP54153.1 hypothetical protein ASB58_14410 [Halopseudomonas gallaeciensis]